MLRQQQPDQIPSTSPSFCPAPVWRSAAEERAHQPGHTHGCPAETHLLPSLHSGSFHIVVSSHFHALLPCETTALPRLVERFLTSLMCESLENKDKGRNRAHAAQAWSCRKESGFFFFSFSIKTGVTVNNNRRNFRQKLDLLKFISISGCILSYILMANPPCSPNILLVLAVSGGNTLQATSLLVE